MKGLISIQYLRAIAALSVLVFHYGCSLDNPHFFMIGEAGVHVFFIISGLIILMVTQERETQPRLFLWRRLVRIIPLYWLATLVTVLLIIVRPKIEAEMITDISIRHVFASLLFIPHMNSHGENYPTSIGGWTLNIEMFFYVVTAGALFLERRFQALAIGGILISLALLGYLLQPHSALGMSYTNSLLIEFIIGMGVGHCILNNKLPPRRMGMFLLVSGFALFLWEHLAAIDVNGPFAIFIMGVPALCMVVGAVSVESDGGVFVFPFLKKLGDASYSIYLLQSFTIFIASRLALPSAMHLPFLVALTIAVSFTSYYLFERPIMRLGRIKILWLQ